MAQIVFELPLVKETKNRVKYGTESKEWGSIAVGGVLYPLQSVLVGAFRKWPTRIKVTIEEVA